MKTILLILAILMGSSAVLAQNPEKAIAYGIVADNSKSVGSQFDHVLSVARALVVSGSPSDEIFLMRFVDNNKIELVSDFTSDKKLVRARSLSRD